MSWKDLIDKPGELNTELLDKFLNAAMTSTGQKEFYTEKDEQNKELIDLHKRMLEGEREVYALSLLLPINDYSKQLIIYLLLKNSKIGKEQKRYENEIINTILNNMPTNRAYKVFTILQKNKVNNRRMKWLAEFFLKNRGNLIFEGVKYKRWIKNLIVHNHLKSGDQQELFDFLFDKKGVEYSNDLLKKYKEAKTNKEAVYALPYSIALGFKNLHKIPDKEFYEKIKGKLTEKEKLLVQRTAKKADVKIETDLTRYEPIMLLKYLRTEDIQKTREELFKIFDTACKKRAKGLPFEFKSIRIVADNSNSMYGSDVKKYHPVSVTEATAHVLKNLSKDVKLISFPNKTDDKSPFLEKTLGPSAVWKAILEALKDKPEVLVIISDAYENAPAGFSKQVLDSYIKKIDKKGETLIIHINPVFAPEAEDIKKLTELIQTFGIRDTRQLYLILLLSIVRHKDVKKLKKIYEDLRLRVEPIKIQVKKKKKKEAKK